MLLAEPPLTLYQIMVYNEHMKSEWSVSLTRKAQKGKKNLLKHAHRAFLHLLMELKEGPEKTTLGKLQ